MAHHFFTSESVTEGHPDKICDQISDAILNEILTQDPYARVACETTCTTGMVQVMGEISTSCYVDIPKVVRDTVREIGYDRAKYGFDCDTCAVLTAIDEQSADIALGVDQFTYLLSRIRGTNGFPKQVKATTNPGGVGHQWVKSRFIDSMPPDTVREFDGGTRLFLPARLGDNPFLRKADAGYEKRLKLLSPTDRKALLDGVWELNEGQYFSEFSRDLHVVKPYAIPHDWRRCLTIDYGLDMLAALWIAQSPDGHSVVYRELYRPGLIISEAAAQMLACETAGEHIDCRLAPPDLWNRRQETGRSAVELFADSGLDFVKSSNERVAGWLALHELLQPRKDTDGAVRPRLTIFDTCHNLIRTLPALQHDKRNPSDTANTPHELTHAPDALRGYAATVYEPVKAVPQSAYDCEVGEFLRF